MELMMIHSMYMSTICATADAKHWKVLSRPYLVSFSLLLALRSWTMGLYGTGEYLLMPHGVAKK